MTDERSYQDQVRGWSNIDLLDVAKHIDKDAHPERSRIVQEEIEQRRNAPAPAVVPAARRPSPSKYATFWRRVGAILLDWLIFLPVVLGAEFLADAATDPAIAAAPGLAATLLFLLYSIILHARNGQTVGKMATYVRVVDISEGKLTIAQAITRDLVPLFFAIASYVVTINIELPVDISKFELVTLAPSLFLGSIGVLWGLAEIFTMATNRKRRAVHDFIAGSVVVRTGKGGSTP